MSQARWGISRSQIIIVGLLVVALVVIAYFQSQPDTTQVYNPADTRSEGLRALVLWLEEMGYDVAETMPRAGLPADTSLLFIFTHEQALPLYATDAAARAEAETAYVWVEQGGTLVLIGPASPYLALEERFGVGQAESLTGMMSRTRQVQPLLPALPADWASFYAPRVLEIEPEHAFVPLLAQISGAPVVTLQFIGDGVVWHLTEDFAFTNLNLDDERIASLVPAILRTVPRGAPVVIHTPHLSTSSALAAQEGEAGTLQDWLYTTPFGQATLVMMVAVLGYLILQGRRLGPALATPGAARPREAAEYVSALAGLQRRMRQPQTVAAHHRQRLKHAIGRLTQTPADLLDGEWLAQVERSDTLPPDHVNTLGQLLDGYARVEAGSDGEADLIQLVQATDALLADLPRANKQLVR